MNTTQNEQSTAGSFEVRELAPGVANPNRVRLS